MGISWNARELVKLEHFKATAEIQKRYRKEIERLRVTLPRSGMANKTIDDRHVECMRESLADLTTRYIGAYEHEGVELTVADIDYIIDEMATGIRGIWQSRVELEPRSVGLQFREDLDQLVQEQRRTLVIAMKRMQHERVHPRRAEVEPKHIYNISGANARLNINSTDTSVNVVTVAANQLFLDLRATINASIASEPKRAELLGIVDELEATQGTSKFLERYQAFVGTLADHISLFQAFLPALSQLIS